MKLYYVVNARLPNKKAYGIQIAKMCEAFIEAGADLTLVIPRTKAAQTASMRDFYGLRVEVPTKILPGFDWYAGGRLPFFLSSLIFMKVSGLYLLWKRIRGERAVVYTIDMDTFSFSFLPLCGFPIVAEMHDTKPAHILARFFFRHIKGIVATNEEIKHSLVERFRIPSEKIIVESNGVDFSIFFPYDRNTARSGLSIPREETIALYAGRFYEWKGLGILGQAARLAPDVNWYAVGGTPKEFIRATGVVNIPANLTIVPEKPIGEVPQWLAAADALLVLGTKMNARSYLHTSPMKVYEYMAAQKPIVASSTPALQSIIGPDEVVFYEPDNATALVEAVRKSVKGSNQDMIARAAHSAADHSWQNRAERIGAILSI